MSLMGGLAVAGCANRDMGSSVNAGPDASLPPAGGSAGSVAGGSGAGVGAGGISGGSGMRSDGGPSSSGGQSGAAGTTGGAKDAGGSSGAAGKGDRPSPDAGAAGGIAGHAGTGGGGHAGGASGSSGGRGGATTGGSGGTETGAAVDGWYEAEAVPPNVLTYAATVSHTDEGQSRACPVDTAPGLSQVAAHGVTEGANCASAGGMVVNILGRSPCNPETPSSYSNCQNLGAGVEFHAVTVPADGTYDVTWWYHCGLDDHYGDTKCGGVKYSVGSSCRPHLIDVNGVAMSTSAGAKYYQFPCFATAWSLIHAATTALPLKAGANTIYIHAPGATTLDAADIDAINVLPQGRGAPPLSTPVATGD
jgi:hypothetical protein